MKLSTLLSMMPGGSEVCALPSWSNPRLLFSSGTAAERWNRSGLFPAFRLRGRLYRTAVRSRVALVPNARPRETSRDWLLADFVEDILPEISDASVLVGTPGPTQKVTVQFRGTNGEVVAYGKYAEGATALERLRRESALLNELPDEAAPRNLKFGAVGDGEMLIVSTLDGDPVTVSLPPPDAVADWCSQRQYGKELDVAEHPWLNDLIRRSPNAAKLAADLASHRWKLAIQHGDYAPWNLRLRSGAVSAFDWEFGRVDGFPFADLAFYFLQTAALVHDMAPREALQQTASYLADRVLQPDASVTAATALAKLALLDAYFNARDDGHTDDEPLQAWRLSVLGGLV